jgi:hypothetical protein
MILVGWEIECDDGGMEMERWVGCVGGVIVKMSMRCCGEERRLHVTVPRFPKIWNGCVWICVFLLLAGAIHMHVIFDMCTSPQFSEKSACHRSGTKFDVDFSPGNLNPLPT